MPLYISPGRGAEQIRFSRGSERVCIYLTNLTTKVRGGSVYNNNKSKNSLYIIYISIFLWMIIAHFLRDFPVSKILRQTNYNSLHNHNNRHRHDCFGRLRTANCVHGAYIYAIRCKSRNTPKIIAQNETIKSNHDSSKLITRESDAITIYSTIPNRWNNQQSQE